MPEPTAFSRAHAAIDAHDLAGLTAALDADPAVVTQTGGTNANDLLGMAAATGSLQAVTLLLDRGADPAQGNVHGWTALHQAAYGDRATLAGLLLDRGAPPVAEARGAGGTPLVVALFWGNRRVAELLAARGGRAPDNLRVAAGLGDAEAVARLAGTPQVGAARAFHRPHSGFPAWSPSDDPQEVLDEALTWAARNDRADVLGALVDAGARLDADPYRGTALVWAAATGALGATRRLLDLGAAVDARSTFGGPDHGDGVTALHIAAQSGRRDVARLLVEAGADRGLRRAARRAAVRLGRTGRPSAVVGRAHALGRLGPLGPDGEVVRVGEVGQRVADGAEDVGVERHPDVGGADLDVLVGGRVDARLPAHDAVPAGEDGRVADVLRELGGLQRLAEAAAAVALQAPQGHHVRHVHGAEGADDADRTERVGADVELAEDGGAEGHDARNEVRPADREGPGDDAAAALPDDRDALAGLLEELLEALLHGTADGLAAVDVAADARAVGAVAETAEPAGHDGERAVTREEAGDQEDGPSVTGRLADAAPDVAAQQRCRLEADEALPPQRRSRRHRNMYPHSDHLPLATRCSHASRATWHKHRHAAVRP